MKQIVIFLFAVLFLSSSSCVKPVPPEEEKDREFVSNSYNGDILCCMADAYKTFLETDALPVYINVQGIKFNSAKYVAASCVLLKKIAQQPDSWEEGDVEFVTASCPDNKQNNTFDRDVISMDEVLSMTDKIYDFACQKKIFPNYCTMESGHKDEDGSVYDTKLIINAAAVMYAGIFAYYREHSSLPDSVTTWHSSFLCSTNNCNKDSQKVRDALSEAVAGKNTDYDKAKAIFEYVRDKFEWEDYYNTSKGADGTITSRGGNCCDLSHTIVAMSRAAGIPARYRHAQCMYSRIIGHVMAEIYVGGRWYLCDASNNSNSFGKHEAWKYMETFNGYYNELPF